MTPRHKLSAGKKIDFSSPPSLESDACQSKIVKLGTDAADNYYYGEEDSIDYYALDDHCANPVIIEPDSKAPQVQHSLTLKNSKSSALSSIHQQKKNQEKDYQEILIVRNAVDFDERSFRDLYVRSESEIILRMRRDIDALYDWLDRLVADLTKSLNTFQETRKCGVEEKLKAIRENSVRADAINRTIQNFLTSIHHAYQHTFSAFLDSNANINNIDINNQHN